MRKGSRTRRAILPCTSWMYSAAGTIGDGYAEIRQRRSTRSCKNNSRRRKRQLGKQFGFHSRRSLAMKKRCMKSPLLCARFRNTRRSLREGFAAGSFHELYRLTFWALRRTFTRSAFCDGRGSFAGSCAARRGTQATRPHPSQAYVANP